MLERAMPTSFDHRLPDDDGIGDRADISILGRMGQTGQTILLVDDSDEDADLTTYAFSQAGVDARLVRLRDGAEALEYLLGEHAGTAPEAVLLDLRMPRVDGFGVLSALQADERTRQLPVIVMTSSVDDEDRLKAYQGGALAFVRKPLNYREFVRAYTTMNLHWSAAIDAFGQSERR